MELSVRVWRNHRSQGYTINERKNKKLRLFPKRCRQTQSKRPFRNGLWKANSTKEAGRNKRGQAKWECQCEYGKKVIVDSGNLCKRHGTKSCGCLNSGDDSIQALLNGNFRTPEDAAFFYIFALNRFPELTKPSIAKDIQRRADDEHGVMYDFIAGTRLEAWLIEQAILFETKHKLEIPEALEDWDGASELRRAGASEIFKMGVTLHELMIDIGMAEFACRFLPTTPEQRIKLAEIL